MTNQEVMDLQKIILHKINPQTVQLFYKELFIAYVNEYELNDVRIQIKLHQLDGFYCLFDNKKLYISKNGKIPKPDGFFTLFDDQLDKLIDFK